MQKAPRWFPTAGLSAGDHSEFSGVQAGLHPGTAFAVLSTRIQEVASHREWLPGLQWSAHQVTLPLGLQVSGKGLGDSRPGILSPGTCWRTSDTAEVCCVWRQLGTGGTA